MAEKILEVKDLKINFKTDHGVVQAVRGVSFDLERGETLCIVGESGSGKSVTSKAIMGILANNAVVVDGSITYQGENLLEVSEEEFHKIRGHKIGMIFQDPLSSLNPIVRIGKQITEATLINSDKLKQMYEELISKELTAYKNTIAKRNILVAKEKEKYETLRSQKESLLKNKETSGEVKNQIKQEIRDAKALCQSNVAKFNADAKEKLVPLKAALNEKKAFAKTEVAAYKKRITEEHQAKLAYLNEKYQQALAEDNNNVSIQEKKDALSKEYEAELAKAASKEEKQALKKKYVQNLQEYLLTTKSGKLAKEIEDEKIDYVNKLRITRKEAKRKALEIMSEVGIPLPEKRFRQYPFEFSGGMRQRIVIAIALTATPEILICDEPTTALDVTIQAQILELIKKIQRERNIACIFITHDLGVVANMADRVAVMYAGKIVEYGKSEEIFFEPKHPYTWALLSSIPDVDSKERLEAIPGTPPDMIYPPKGDAFALRSKYAMKIDFEHEPPFFKISDTHYAATWLLHPNAPKVEMPKIVSERIKNALAGETLNEPVKEEKKPTTKKSSTAAKASTGTTKKVASKSGGTKTAAKKTASPKNSNKKVKGASLDE